MKTQTFLETTQTEILIKHFTVVPTIKSCYYTMLKLLKSYCNNKTIVNGKKYSTTDTDYFYVLNEINNTMKPVYY